MLAKIDGHPGRYTKPLVCPHSVVNVTKLTYLSTVALMEYHCTKDAQIASRIFDTGLKTFGDEVEFALRYLGFLISVNDDMSTSSLSSCSSCVCSDMRDQMLEPCSNG